MNIFFMNFKRGMKSAFTIVKSNFKEYICFIIALLMVQMLFGVLTIAFYNNEKVEKQLILDAGYDYHVALDDLQAQDINILTNIYTYHESQHTLTFEYATAGNSYHIFFTSQYANTYRIFSEAVKQMNAGYDHVSLQTTPLYDYDSSSSGAFSKLLPLLGVMMILSYFLIMALFRIRLNHFKFTYGIYMTFGADNKKLFSAAFYEMILLVALVFPVSIILSYISTALLYLPNGAPFGFYFAALPIVLFCSLLCSLLALILPIKLLARSMPVKALKAEDNSNLVSSARRSKNILRKKIAQIELLGLWRFKKHIAILLLSTVSFALVFLLGCYLADAYTVRQAVNRPDFTVKAQNENVYAAFSSFFKTQAEYNDVNATLEKSAVNPFKEGGTRQKDTLPNMMVEASLAHAPFFTESPTNEGYIATEQIEFRAFDEDAYRCLDSVYGYSCKGDPSILLEDPESVIVSSHLAGTKSLFLEPGDTIYLSTNYIPLPGAAVIAEDLTYFEGNLAGGIYTYRAYKVAAVIENYTDFDNMLIYLSSAEKEGQTSAWEAVMGEKPLFREARIHTSSARDEKLSALIIADYLASYGSITYERSYSSLYTTIDSSKNFKGLFLFLSFLVLGVSPLAGIFSQILFYGKRKLEFDVIRAVGGTKKELRTLFTVDALVMMLLSGGLYVAFSFLAVRLAAAFLNSRFAFIFSSESTRATTFYPDMPLLPFFAGLILTVLFAGIAVLLPALINKKQSNAHIAADFGRTDE